MKKFLLIIPFLVFATAVHAQETLPPLEIKDGAPVPPRGALQYPVELFEGRGFIIPKSAEERIDIVPHTATAEKNSPVRACTEDWRAVSVDLQTEKDVYEPYESISFSGSIQNHSPYPIPDSHIRIRIFRKEPDEKMRRRFGDHIVEEWYLPKNFSLQHGESESLSFLWVVPRGTVAGDYYTAVELIASGAFHIIGTPYSDNSSVGYVPFKISGPSRGVYVDRSTVTLAGEPYAGVGAVVEAPEQEEVTVTIPIDNTLTSNESQEVSVSWKHYSGGTFGTTYLLDASDGPSNLLLGPDAHANQTISVSTRAPGLHSIVFDVSWGGAHSLYIVRFYQYRGAYPAIRYLGVDSYPLTAKSNVVVCLEQRGEPTGFTTVDIAISEPDGRVRDTVRIREVIPSPMKEFIELLNGVSGLQSFGVYAKLKNEGHEPVELFNTYRCESLVGAPCSTSVSIFSPFAQSVLITLSCLVLLVIGAGIVLRRKGINFQNLIQKKR